MSATAAAAVPDPATVRDPVLRGPRLVLQAPTARDEVAFLRATKASASLHTPWAAPPADAARYAAFLERSSRPDASTFLAHRGADGEGVLVAVVTLSQIFLGASRNACLGYSAFAPHDGKGYTTEAVRLVLAHAFDELRLHSVEANVAPANARSQALVRRCGFRRDGHSPRYLHIHGAWRGHERWALSEQEWRTSEPAT